MSDEKSFAAASSSPPRIYRYDLNKWAYTLHDGDLLVYRRSAEVEK